MAVLLDTGPLLSCELALQALRHHAMPASLADAALIRSSFWRNADEERERAACLA